MGERKGNALLLAGLGCGALVLVTACGISVAWLLVDNQESPAVGQARGFFADLRAGDYPSALTRTNAAYQSTHTVEAFQVAVTTLPAAVGHTGVTFGEGPPAGTSVTLTGNLATPTGQVPVTVALSVAGAHWYIDAVTVDGQPLP